MFLFFSDNYIIYYISCLGIIAYEYGYLKLCVEKVFKSIFSILIMQTRFIPRTPKSKSNIIPYWDLIKRIIVESDILLEVIDARMVGLSRNEEVENLIKEIGRPVIYVVNKSDLVKKEDLREQLGQFGEDKVIFVSNKDKASYKILLYTIRKEFKKNGKRVLPTDTGTAEGYKFRLPSAEIVVGVLGYPNVGKSSIINGLAHKKKVKVSKKAGTTHGMHWIRVSEDIKVIDSPGVIPLKTDDDLRYGLIGARDIDKIRDLDSVSYGIIKMFMKNNKKSFEKYFDIKIDEEEKEDVDLIVEKIGKRKGYMQTGGSVDENRVFTNIIKSWQDGKLRI